MLQLHTREITSVAFSHDSKYLASASYDNTIRLWKIES
jgi:WD40 repeat protein